MKVLNEWRATGKNVGKKIEEKKEDKQKWNSIE